MGGFVKDNETLPAGTITPRANATTYTGPANAEFGANHVTEIIARIDAAHGAANDLRTHTSGVVNLQSYAGLVSNDDWTSAINAALTAASTSPHYYGKVVFGEGQRPFTGRIIVPNGVSIEGAGAHYGSVLMPRGVGASITFLGSDQAGGWSFRQSIRNLTIRHDSASAAPTSGRLVELNSAYNVDFWNVLVADVPSGTTAWDITNCNDLNFYNARVRTVDGSSNTIGLNVKGFSTVKLYSPDIEETGTGIQNNDTSIVDVFGPFFERNILGIANWSSSGKVSTFGGYITASNDSGWPVASYVSGAETNVFLTRLANGAGTNKFHRASGSRGVYVDESGRVQIGAVATTGNAAIPALLTLNEPGAQGAEHGIALGAFRLHIGSVSTFPDDLAVAWTGAGDKTFRFFGNGASLLSLYSDGQITAGYGFALGATDGPKILSGSGSPEGVVTAPTGSTYVNTAGGASTTLYVKTSGTGNTGWTAK
jgi:hypothetical protein